MNPLFGGTLANPPPTVRAIWDAAGPPGHPVDSALQWLWHKPEVSFVLSGMSTLDQVRQNIGSACRSRVGGLTTETVPSIWRFADCCRVSTANLARSHPYKAASLVTLTPRGAAADAPKTGAGFSIRPGRLLAAAARRSCPPAAAAFQLWPGPLHQLSASLLRFRADVCPVR